MEEAAVVGTVHSQDIVGKLVSGVTVQAVLEGKLVAETVTDDAGRYRIDVDTALSELCLLSGKQQGKKTPHWRLTLRYFKDGFAPTEGGTTVPRLARPVDVYLVPRAE